MSKMLTTNIMQKDLLMKFDQQYLENVTTDIIESLGEIFKWKWEENRQALLSEFARDKKDICLPVLRKNFIDEWDNKNIKKAPKQLKSQLGELAKLSKEQKLFTRPATDNHPALLAIWWPWGHGGTYSLRLVILAESYTLTEISKKNEGFFTSLINRFIKN